MMRFLYWATTKEGKEVNFISENLYEEGIIVEYQGEEVLINDLAIEEDISCEEINMQIEDMIYYI